MIGKIDIEFSREFEEWRDIFSRLASELPGEQGLVEALADEVMVPLAVEAFDRAKGMPLAQSTLDRKQRSVKKSKAKHGRKARPGRSRHGRTTGVLKGTTVPLGRKVDGLFGALTAAHDETGQLGAQFARRDIIGRNEMIWGTRGIVDYAGDHVWGTRTTPARLSLLQLKGEGMDIAEAKTRAVYGERLRAAMERAGAPAEAIAELSRGL